MIIFDLDGTLWDTIDTTYQATMNITSNRKDIPKISKKTVKTGMGLTLSENAKHYMPTIAKEKREEILKEINEETIRLLKLGKTKFYMGMKKTLQKLSENYDLGIVTNNNDDYAKIFLETSNLKEYFKDYMGAASHDITKGEAIQLMINRNHQKEGYYVGDTKKDLEAAKEANVIFIHAKYGVDKKLSTPYSIKSIIFLPSLLKKIEKEK